MRRLLLVEPCEAYGGPSLRVLTGIGFDVHWTMSLRQARAVLECPSSNWHFALIEDRLPDGFGSELVPLLTARNPAPAIALMTAAYSNQRALEAFRVGRPLLSRPTPSGLMDLIAALEPEGSGGCNDVVGPHAAVAGQAFGRFVLESRSLRTPTGPVPLRTAEVRLLAYLLNHAPSVATSADLARSVFGRRDTGALGLVRRHVANLRQGLARHAWIVESVAGEGYRVAGRAREESAAE